MVLWSEHSRDSDYVLEEAEHGKEKKNLFPALIESVRPPYGFGRIQAANLIDWKNTAEHAGLTELLNPLRQHLNDHTQEPTTTAQPKPEKHTQKTILTPGQTFSDPLKIGGKGPLMVVIPAGEFLMGSPHGEKGRYSDEDPQHNVQIAKPFAIGVYTITFDDYDLFCTNTQREKHPAINISWHNAQAYCAWLSEQTGRNYRLPSESTWEYACRAGKQTPYHTGETITKEQANFNQNIGKTTTVGSYQPNDFGIYDMHGNVWEWCQDTWHENYENAPSDGSPWEDNEANEDRVLRGGSWYRVPDDVRSSTRSYFHPNDRDDNVGFRVLCSSPIE